MMRARFESRRFLTALSFGLSLGASCSDDSPAVRSEALLGSDAGPVRSGAVWSGDAGVKVCDFDDAVCLDQLDASPPSCGDGVLSTASGEECEPPGSAFCDENCRRIQGCGDTILDEGEECDDGNQVDGDHCDSHCRLEACGNNRLDVGESCEPPNTARCSATCQELPYVAGCGNGVLDPGEDCDDGNLTAGDGCSPVCQEERCGNQRIDSGETCEPPGTATCGPTCKTIAPAGAAVCGNGQIEQGEECDDGKPPANGDGCSERCLLEVCGNGRLDFGEACEPQNNEANCSPTCKLLFCGDGTVTAARGEECDDTRLTPAGAPQSGDGCSADCKIERCGNNRIDVGEECEPPGTARCDAQCKTIVPPSCGDKIVQPPEECDDGNKTLGDGCDDHCRKEGCGNGIVEPARGEECEPTTTPTAHPTCDANCKTIRCGNGVLETGEECDDGNALAGDGCNSACLRERCGNGVLDPGERCEPPGTSSCDSACLLIVARCGDGVVTKGLEECDDSNTVSGDGCSAACLIESCGNGRIDVGEDCEPPNFNSCDAACHRRN